MSDGDRKAGKPRVIEPVRTQPRFDIVDPERWLPADDPARAVWAYVAGLDLAVLYDRIKARGSAPGRPAADPRVLLALWLLATIDGIGAARELERCCRERLPYMWLRQEVPVNYHGLADFRVAHADVLDALLTKHLAAMIAAGLATPAEIVVDGTKVRASANRSSFRGPRSLGEIEAAAQARVAHLRAEIESDPAAADRRRQAANERAARERAERVADAQQKLAEIEAEREKRAETSPKEVAEMKEPRASTTDPQARQMLFADGATRPGYNIQVASTSEGLVTAIRTTDRRQDSGLARPMVEASEQRTGVTVVRVLADTGYVDHGDIAALETRPERPVTCFIPPPGDRIDVKPSTLKARARAREREPEPIKAWRARMATQEAKATMKTRSGIERINAAMKHRGFGRLTVRGLVKVQAIALWQALAHNFTTGLRLIAAAAARTAAA